jgi:hypothetical protein
MENTGEPDAGLLIRLAERVRARSVGKVDVFDCLSAPGFTPAGLDSPQTVERRVQRVSRLYEHGADMIHIGA